MKNKINALLPHDFNGIIRLQMQDETLEIIKGFRELPNRIPIISDTKFGTASVGKAFVAVAILQLIEAKKLTFETTLQDIFKNQIGKLAMQTTIKALLTHQSAIPDYFYEEKFTDYSELWQTLPNYTIRKNRDIFPLFIHKEPVDDSKFRYNNSGYILLAEVIEALTELPFDEYLQKNIFIPAQMFNTGYYALDMLPPNTATAYIFDKTAYHSNIYSIDVKGTGAGGCFTTVKDLQLFWQALDHFKLLDEANTLLLTNPTFSQVENYGLGFWLLKHEKFNEPFIYLQGADPGITALSIHHVSTNFMLTIFSNTASDIWQLRRDIWQLLFS